MTYSELRHIFKTTKPLEYNLKTKAFSTGIGIISKNVYADFWNIDESIPHQLILMYGHIQEVLDSITKSEAIHLAELGWFITDGLSEEDNYFKYRL